MSLLLTCALITLGCAAAAWAARRLLPDSGPGGDDPIV
jgi:hypothetical protein